MLLSLKAGVDLPNEFEKVVDADLKVLSDSLEHHVLVEVLNVLSIVLREINTHEKRAWLTNCKEHSPKSPRYTRQTT